MAKVPNEQVTVSESIQERLPKRIVALVEQDKLAFKEAPEQESEPSLVVIIFTGGGIYFDITGKITWRLRWAKIATAVGTTLGVVWAFLKHFQII